MNTSDRLNHVDVPASAGRTPLGPRGHFLFGSMFEFQKDRLGFVTRMASEYGDVVRFRVANLVFYQVNHPQGVQRILQDNNHNYIKGDSFQVFRTFVGHSLFTSEGDFWLRLRRLMQPVFHRQRLAGFADLMSCLTQEMLEGWQPWAHNGQPFDIAEQMTRLTMQIVTQALFSSQVAGEAHAIGQAVTLLLADAAYRFDVPFYPALSVPTPHNQRTRAAQRLLDQTIYSIIAERRQRVESAQDLLGMLMQARDDKGEGMSDEQLHNEALTMFIAGHETTANALTWAWYLLAQHPHVEQRLHEELEQTLQGRPPSGADLPRLAYTRMLLEETMRLYPPAWITNRSVVEDDEICGYHIPRNSVVAISPYAMQRDPRFWEEPEVFDPQRFAPGQGEDRPNYAYFPFGGGPHQCIGKGFALMEATLVLAAVAQRYRLVLHAGQHIEPLPQITLRPRDGIQVIALPR